MPAPFRPPKVEFDTDDLEAILVVIHGPEFDRLHTAIRNRLVYLQKRDFPPGARAGRGRRSAYGISDALSTLFAFQLMNLHVPPTTATAMVEISSPFLMAELVAGWRAIRMREATGTEGSTAAAYGEIAYLNRIAIARPHLLSDDPAGLIMTFISPTEMNLRIRRGERLSAFIAIELTPFLEIALATMTTRLKVGADLIDAAMAELAEATFGTDDERRWTPAGDIEVPTQ